MYQVFEYSAKGLLTKLELWLTLSLQGNVSPSEMAELTGKECQASFLGVADCREEAAPLRVKASRQQAER